ncbi:MAG: MBL fold metallo-hydrolase [Lachnospiraceae bacterium]|nr:MBL fold metallo-hydrolase [Lachnospiraceae bacterium]
MEIAVFTQNSIRLRTKEMTIYVDPFSMREEPKDADYILVTHEHYDHFSPEDIAKVSSGSSVMVVPESMEKKAMEAKELVGRIITVVPKESYEMEGFRLETVPAYNPLKPFHPKGKNWVGYVIEADGERVYVAGDTDDTKEAKEVRCDIALVPIGGTYTMDVKKAAELISVIRPKLAIPTHYRQGIGSEKAGEEFARLVPSDVKVEILKQY